MIECSDVHYKEILVGKDNSELFTCIMKHLIYEYMEHKTLF